MVRSLPRAASAGSISLGDMRVARIGFGAMRTTGPGVWGEPRDRAEIRRLLRRVVELGVGLIDTADSYGPDVSEELIAEALYPYPDNLIIATKGGSLRPGPGQWVRDGRPEHLKRVCHESLRRLKLEQIPLYQLHAPAPNASIEESVGALVDLQREGCIKHIGVSNVTEAELDRALAIGPIVAVQNRYSLVDRRFDALVDRCTHDGIAFMPWAPLERGDVHAPEVLAVAARHDASVAQVMLAWLLQHSPALLPIPGTAALAHLEENVAAAALCLSDADVALLDSVAERTPDA